MANQVRYGAGYPSCPRCSAVSWVQQGGYVVCGQCGSYQQPAQPYQPAHAAAQCQGQVGWQGVGAVAAKRGAGRGWLIAGSIVFVLVLLVTASLVIANRSRTSPYNVDGVGKDHRPLRKLLEREIGGDAEVAELHVDAIFGRVVVIEGNKLIEHKFTHQMDQRNALSSHNLSELKACAMPLDDIDLRAVKRIIVDAKRRLPKGTEIRYVSWRCRSKPTRWIVGLKSSGRLKPYFYELDGSRAGD